MRRLLFWFLPTTSALVAAVAFGAGFYSYVTGRVGTPVDWAPRPTAAASAPLGRLSPVILGDSLARGTGDQSGLGIGGRLEEELKRRRILTQKSVNLAVNGARTNDLLQQLESPNVRRIIGESNVVVISIGGNDLWGGNEFRNQAPPNPDAVMGEVMDRVEKIVKTVREANPKARIFFVGLYNPFVSQPFGKELTPLVNRWNGKLLDRLGGDPNFTLVATSDLFAFRDRLSLDRFHPNSEGYTLIARRIADSL